MAIHGRAFPANSATTDFRNGDHSLPTIALTGQATTIADSDSSHDHRSPSEDLVTSAFLEESRSNSFEAAYKVDGSGDLSQSL
jgi:hypothetical protein